MSKFLNRLQNNRIWIEVKLYEVTKLSMKIVQWKHTYLVCESCNLRRRGRPIRYIIVFYQGATPDEIFIRSVLMFPRSKTVTWSPNGDSAYAIQQWDEGDFTIKLMEESPTV